MSSEKGIDAMRGQKKGVLINPSRDPRLSHKERMAMRRMAKLHSRNSNSVLQLSEKEISWKEKQTAKSNTSI
jgi:hypothetical protein